MERNRCPQLAIVVPCYNEEQVLPVIAPVFSAKLRSLTESGRISEDSYVLFVDDGSKDGSWEIIEGLAAGSNVFRGISLSRNNGHQNAILAGLTEVTDQCDISITIDCDGQDDPDAMDEMVDAYVNGAEIVYGVRNDRSSDGFFKRTTAQGFYKIMRGMGAEVIYNHADYRLVSNRVLRELVNYKEVNLFLRGMFPLVGFNSTSVYYKREKRIAGKGKYPLSKMIKLSFDGITSFSVRPIRMIAGLGAFISLISLGLIVYALIGYFSGNTVPGWTSSMIAVAFIGGIQLLSLGVIGEYVGRIYMETKGRPRYIISERTFAETGKERQER